MTSSPAALAKRYATPFVTGLFLVSTVSGVALFLGIGTGLFHEMHEILSLVLVVPFLLHVWRNWPAFTTYFRRAPMWIGLAVSLLAAVPFAMEGLSRTGGNPAMRLASALQQAPLTVVAEVVKTPADVLVRRLDAAGLAGTAATDTLAGLAERSGRNPMELMAIVAEPAS